MDDIFQALGFRWNRKEVPACLPVHSLERVCFRFHRMLPEYVWDAGVLEGNPFTFPEVKTLLDGVTVGGRKLHDQQQIIGLASSARRLLAMVRSGLFQLNKATFTELHAIVAQDEALEWGHFRGEGNEVGYTPDVMLGERGRYTPLPTVRGAAALNQVFASGQQRLVNDIENAYERALATFLFGALQQFFFDGNKRTSRLMMNGVLMSNGLDAISVPASRAGEFNQKMVDFYLSRDGSEMMAFLGTCYPQERAVADTTVDRTSSVRQSNRSSESFEP